MFKQAILVCMLALGLGITTPAWAQTYYTDAVNGNDANTCAQAQSSTTAKRSIGGSIGSSSAITNGGASCLTVPGTTLLVENGTYVEGMIELIVSGTQGSPITIKAVNQLQAILSSTSNSGGKCQPNISMSASWLVIDGLRGQIDPTDNNTGCTNNSANGVFARMWGTNTPQLGGNTSTGNVGGVVRNCQVDASTHRSTGIKSNQDSSLVENCTMHAGLEVGLDANAPMARNNYIDTPDVWGAYLFVKGGSRNVQMYNNTVVMSTSGGVAQGYLGLSLGGNTGCTGCWWDGTTDYECYNCVAYNNVVYVPGTNLGYAMGFTGCNTCSLLNNVVINGSLFMATGGQTGFIQPAPIASTINNNIISCQGGSATSNWGIAVNTFINYNLFFNCANPPSQVNGQSTDPLFVNAISDWHLQTGSPAIGTGTVTSMSAYGGGSISVNLDKTGALRTIPWDMGIYKSAASNLIPKAPTGIRIF